VLSVNGTYGEKRLEDFAKVTKKTGIRKSTVPFDRVIL
jgi:hypothetical protein